MGHMIGMPCLKLNNTGKKTAKCGSFGAVAAEALEERHGRDADIDHEKTTENLYTGFRTADELEAYSREHVAELSEKQRAAGGRGIRGDAVVMCATIIKPPAAFMNTLSREEQIRFLRDAEEKLDELIGGAQNSKSSVIHFDEQGGHLHKFWEPMTEDGRLCAKEMMNLKFFNRLNREMPQHMRSRGWDIDDCKAYDEAAQQLKTEQEKAEQRKQRGLTSIQYKAKAEAEKNRICEEIDVLKVENAELEAEAAELKAETAELKADLATTQAAVNQAHQRLLSTEDTLSVLEKRTALIQTIEEYHQEADEIEKKTSALDRLLDGLKTAIRLFKRKEALEFIEDFKTTVDGVFGWIRGHLARVQEFELRTRMEPERRRSPSLEERIRNAADKASRQDVPERQRSERGRGGRGI